MTEIVVEYRTLSLAQQVLERQQSHAERIAGYLATHADIGDSTGLLLSMFDPLSRVAVEAGAYAAQGLGQIELTAATAVGLVAQDMSGTDTSVSAAFGTLLGQLGGSAPATGYPDLAGPALGPAQSAADSSYGSVGSYAWEKVAGIADTVGDAVDDAQGLIESVGAWGSPGRVAEAEDAASYLVPGQAPDNFVQDLRWSAGALLGSIDWVAEQFIGFSILERCVFHPFAGDWQGIARASQAWGHAGDAALAIAKNNAALVASTPATWQGLSGNSFRAAMAAVTAAGFKLSAAYAAASDLVGTISTVCKLACVAIGKALDIIATKLLKMAAEAATPVVGWAAGAVTAYSDINKIIGQVRLVYTIIETIISAIEDFVEAKTSITDTLSILEDLLQGLATSAGGVPA